MDQNLSGICEGDYNVIHHCWQSVFMSAFYWKLDSVGNVFSSGDYLVEVDETYRPNSENLEGKNSALLVL